MAVVMGGRVREVAVIKSAHPRQGEIEGTFSQNEVTMLSKLLRTGALPASLNSLRTAPWAHAGRRLHSRRRHGSHCRRARRHGLHAHLLQGLGHQRRSGACSLTWSSCWDFMGYSAEATLTLPGIAGVILTIGMGVDSNVLIFERIREEIRAGKAASAAVDQGFAHAWVTIVDTHVTTIVSAAILFLFGTGPVKGFATYTDLRSAANLFTAVYVSRVIFEAHLNKLKAGRDGFDLELLAASL
jgi:preprotein translocase subunit SecD